MRPRVASALGTHLPALTLPWGRSWLWCPERHSAPDSQMARFAAAALVKCLGINQLKNVFPVVSGRAAAALVVGRERLQGLFCKSVMEVLTVSFLQPIQVLQKSSSGNLPPWRLPPPSLIPSVDLLNMCYLPLCRLLVMAA